MPVSQNTRGSSGDSLAHNSVGVALRTLGGLFRAPTFFSSFGTDPSADSTFPNNSVQTLGSVNFPAYAFTKGTVARISFGGVLLWNGFPAGFASLRLQVTPNAAGFPYNLSLGTGVVTTGAVTTYCFGGQVTLFAPEAPSSASSVAISALVSDIQDPLAPTAPVFTLPQGSGMGLLSLDTTGLASGIDFNLQMSLTGGASIGLTQLRYFLTEMVGG